MTSISLPIELQNAISKTQTNQTNLNAGVKSLTTTYRSGGVSAPTMDFNAYLAARLPATFAAVRSSLREAARLAPDFVPQTMLDLGCGPGTASWAAVETWPGIKTIHMVDNNQKFLEVAKNLAVNSSVMALQYATYAHGDLRVLADQQRADLVVVAYALAELSATDATKAINQLWALAGEVLVIVEPGSKHGFARIAAARAALIAVGANLIAPCGHQAACPMTNGDWCHFAVRLPRSRTHLHAKQASVPYEDEPYSYLVASRTPTRPTGHRILSRPIDTKPARSLKLCTPDGVAAKTIATRDKQAYKRARKLSWGDCVPQ
jgi:ribosomal protein RSM22 (predicted rRNA methylase)